MIVSVLSDVKHLPFMVEIGKALYSQDEQSKPFDSDQQRAYDRVFYLFVALVCCEVLIKNNLKEKCWF